MADVLGDQWPVGVCFYVGDGEDVKTLAAQIDQDIRRALRETNARIDVRLGEPIDGDVNALAKAIQSDEWSILHIVAHGDPDGRLLAEDEWGDLKVKRDKLSALVRNHRVRLAVVMACYGAKVAEQLVDDGAVDVAIGMTTPMPFSTALSFSKGFYGSLARGKTIRRAFADARDLAGLRVDDLKEELHIFQAEGSNAADRPMCDPADFFLMGNPSDKEAVGKLLAALRPHTGFHVDYSLLGERGARYFGVDPARLMIDRFRQAKVVMLLFEEEREEDVEMAELVARAVRRAAKGEVRMFPVYLKGTEPNPDVPFGMMRVTPAYLERAGSYETLGKWLSKLVR